MGLSRFSQRRRVPSLCRKRSTYTVSALRLTSNALEGADVFSAGSLGTLAFVK